MQDGAAPGLALTGRRILGEAFARACVAQGARVVLTDILHERGERVAAELAQARPGSAFYLPMDLSSPESVARGTAQAKGAVIAITHAMARELGEHGITVNAIAPGLTLVEATEYVPEARHRYYQEGRAITRAQVPADVIGPVLFLLSDGAGYVTGQVLPVNGGFVMH